MQRLLTIKCHPKSGTLIAHVALTRSTQKSNLVWLAKNRLCQNVPHFACARFNAVRVLTDMYKYMSNAEAKYQ